MAWSPPFSHDGFTSAYGRFKTERGGFGRKDGMFLKSLFLPKLSADGEIAVQDPDSVYAQLKHYDVKYTKKEFRGRGTSLIQRCLRDGKFDEVPQIKYFGSLTEPDHNVTTVVEIPFSPASQTTPPDGGTRAVFLGWDKDAVDKAALEYPAKEKAQVLSPVGSYLVVDYKEIKDRVLPNHWKYLRLNIFPTAKTGMFKAEFNFCHVQGIMVICADRAAIEDFGFQESDGGNQNLGPGAGAGGSLQSTNPSYYLKISAREKDTGQITNSPNIGTMEFKDAGLTGFVCETDMPFFGPGVIFTATKGSETPGGAVQEWDS